MKLISIPKSFLLNEVFPPIIVSDELILSHMNGIAGAEAKQGSIIGGKCNKSNDTFLFLPQSFIGRDNPELRLTTDISRTLA